MTNIEVSCSKTYEVSVGRGLLGTAGMPGTAGAMIKNACGGQSALLVSDDIVGGLYGDAAEDSLRGAGYNVKRFTFPNGENSKNIETFASILNTLAAERFTRTDVVAALGGGVTGDMGGFAAAVYMRGIKLAQIPTTLLAMVDSSVGGKTAIDLPGGKNLAGAFYPPDIVVCDVDTLATLPPDVFADGCAEAIKHGVIRSRELFEMLGEPISPSDMRMEDIVARNISIKRDVVVADEFETGLRQILNFGHTIGHGIEKLSGYGVPHGSAVAIGMAVCTRAASRMGYCPPDCCKRLIELLRLYGLPTTTEYTPDELFNAAFADKKRKGAEISLIVPEEIGKCAIKQVSMDELYGFIRAGFE